MTLTQQVRRSASRHPIEYGFYIIIALSLIVWALTATGGLLS